MKKAQIALTFIISVSVMVYGVSSFAQQPPWSNVPEGEAMKKNFMKIEDKNGDGKVTTDECGCPPNEFEILDKDKDGAIDYSEAPASLKDLGHLNTASSSFSITLNGVVFKLNRQYDFFTWKNLPSDVKYERMPVKEFTGPDGVTHYYEAVHLPSGNLNWFQAAYLAQDAGGYLASITSEEENSFVFSLVSDEKFFWFFPPYNGSESMNHYEVGMGPFLGGYQPEGAPEPDGGWKWLSGDKWTYSNWCVNLDDGVIDKDPRPNDQPNNAGGNQRIMGFGEMNQPVPTWGDYMDDTGVYGTTRRPGSSHGFVIEYEKRP